MQPSKIFEYSGGDRSKTTIIILCDILMLQECLKYLGSSEKMLRKGHLTQLKNFQR